MRRLLRLTSALGLAIATIGAPAPVAALTGQTITFVAPAGAVVGRDLMLVATSTSKLTVTFSTSTPEVCATSGATLTSYAPGDCLVIASQAGNSVYRAAAPVTATIPVTVEEGFVGLRQRFFIGTEERLSVPIYVPKYTRIEMRLTTLPELVGQVVEVWWQVGTYPWRKLTTRTIESSTKSARYLFTAWRTNVAYRWRFPGTEAYQAGWSAARRVYAR